MNPQAMRIDVPEVLKWLLALLMNCDVSNIPVEVEVAEDALLASARVRVVDPEAVREGSFHGPIARSLCGTNGQGISNHRLQIDEDDLPSSTASGRHQRLIPSVPGLIKGLPASVEKGRRLPVMLRRVVV